MLSDFWKKLKSGSDIRGIAISDNSGEEVNLTNETVEKISRAFAIWLSKKFGLDYSSITIAIGHDSRLSATRIKNVVINSLRSFGITVYDCSLTSTPAMFLAISVLQCTASIQITASHLPYNRNGFKFFTSDGGLSAKDIEEILEIVQNDEKVISKKIGKVRLVNLMNHYIEKLKKLVKEGVNSKSNFDMPLEGFKIIVDAGNGAGGFFATDVLKPLGADIEGSVGLSPDGKFPIHVPNPEDKEAIEYISNITLSSNADLGIIFDTDVDRAAVIDSSGEKISGTKLVALISSLVLKGKSNSIVVTDSVTYESLKTFVQALGGYQFRYKRGYNNVISMAKRINKKSGDCPLAIETSGHAAFRENDFIDDGAYLACKIIVEMVNAKKVGNKLSDCISSLVIPTSELSLRIPATDKNEMNNPSIVLRDLINYVNSNKQVKIDKDNVEGVRIHFPSKHQNGWILLRESLHNAELVLHAESYALGGLKPMISFIKRFLKKYDFLDISKLENF